jgi:excisionase family DNA binding protein
MTTIAATRPAAQALLDIHQVAEVLNVHWRTVENQAKRRRIPKPIMLGRCRRWSVSALQKWIDDGCPDLSQQSPSVTCQPNSAASETMPCK